MAKKQPASAKGAPRVYAANLETDFAEDPRNANAGTERGHAMLEKSIGEFGAGRSMVADKDGRIVAGNKTREALLAAGITEAIVVETDGTTPVIVQRTDFDLTKPKDRSRRYAYADNRVAEIDLSWDARVLAGDRDDGILDGFFSDKEIDKILASAEAAGVDGVDSSEGEVPEKPADPVAKPGDVWRLGEHRLVVGDSTDSEVLATLLDGELGDVLWTDPPYNVSLGEANNPRKRNRAVKNDDLGGDFAAFVARAVDAWWSPLHPGAVAYVAMSSQECSVLDLALRERNWHMSAVVIWAKDRFTLTRRDFHSQYEPIWYGWKGDAARRRPCARRDVSDVWEIQRPGRSDEHPTMKPIELVTRSLSYSSLVGDVVLDPFGGSGTTLIACERMNRRARLVELDPGYADVIIERWQNATGGKAERANGGKKKR